MRLLISASLAGCSASPDAGSSSLPSVAVHPAVATMLVVSWDQGTAGEAWLSWTVDGVEHRSPTRSVAAGPASEVVLGVPADTRVDQIAVHVDGAVLDGGSATTGPLPEGLEDPSLIVAEPTIRPEPWLLTSVDVGPRPFYGPCYAVILDVEGRIVWYRASTGSRLTWQPRVSRGGDTLLVDETVTYVFDDPGPSTVTRLTLDHAVDETIALPGMALTFDELDDAFVYDEAESDTEFHLTRRNPDGTTERLWSCFPWMEPYSDEVWGCATNTVLWDPQRQTVTWSTFQTHLVVEIDPAIGEVTREYGPYPGGYAFDPPESTFTLQHSPSWTADGTLIVSTHDVDETRQLAREYAVDEAGEVLREIWSVETPDFAEYGGQIQALPSGNRLWQLGTAGVVQEITREGEVVWRVEWPGHLVGNATPIADLYALSLRARSSGRGPGRGSQSRSDAPSP